MRTLIVITAILLLFAVDWLRENKQRNNKKHL